MPTPAAPHSSTGWLWCAWCGERGAAGVLTPGGVVYHLACWRRQVAVRSAGRWRARGYVTGPSDDGRKARGRLTSLLGTP